MRGMPLTSSGADLGAEERAAREPGVGGGLGDGLGFPQARGREQEEALDRGPWRGGATWPLRESDCFDEALGGAHERLSRLQSHPRRAEEGDVGVGRQRQLDSRHVGDGRTHVLQWRSRYARPGAASRRAAPRMPALAPRWKSTCDLFSSVATACSAHDRGVALGSLGMSEARPDPSTHDLGLPEVAEEGSRRGLAEIEGQGPRGGEGASLGEHPPHRALGGQRLPGGAGDPAVRRCGGGPESSSREGGSRGIATFRGGRGARARRGGTPPPRAAARSRNRGGGQWLCGEGARGICQSWGPRARIRAR